MLRELAEGKILAGAAEGIARLVFNNPGKRNAVSLPMWQAVAEALAGFAADPAVRVLLVSGAGGKAFVSGADISRFGEERSGEEAVARYNAAAEAAYAALAAFPRPVIAAIEGACVGGGLALAVCCDLRVAGEGARFGLPAARLGLGYPFAGIARLIGVVGRAAAAEILFTAALFDAAQARAWGLVNRLVPAGQAEAAAEALARAIAANAPLTVAAAKRALIEHAKDPAERDLAAVQAMVEAAFASADYREGQAAFREKRPPRFAGA
ncbi:MAG: enoyl-CoA hydratase [Acetobacteraceae bacterium]|nr:enoyl-CoA hydratase [Acetobacteraceae bacterium]